MLNLSFQEGEMFVTEALKGLGVTEFTRLGDRDIACKCPICGDSRYGKKQRLHYYEKNNVINVNCFNGDCPAKNLSVYRFLQTYSPRTFTKFKDYQRSKWLQQLVKPKSKELETLEMQAGWDEVEIKSKLRSFIANFAPESMEHGWLQIMQFLKENPDSQAEFKLLIS